MIDSPYLVEPGKKFKLHDLRADDTGKFSDKEQADSETKKNLKELAKLQDKLYAQSKHALLIVLQAMDGGGKDGTIKKVFSGVNPQGCVINSFKRPTPLELAHDYL